MQNGMAGRMTRNIQTKPHKTFYRNRNSLLKKWRWIARQHPHKRRYQKQILLVGKNFFFFRYRFRPSNGKRIKFVIVNW